MADERLLQAVDALRFENAQYHDENYAKQGKQVANTELTVKLMGDLLEEFRQGRLDAKGDAEEARRDAKKGEQKDKVKGVGAPKIDDEFNLKGVLQIVAGIGAAVAGFAAGLVSGFGRILSLATKRFRTGVKGLFAPVARFIDAITDVFGKRGTNQFLKGNTYKTLGNLTKTFRGFADGIKGLETRFARALNGIKSIGTTVRSYAGMITNSVKDIAKLKIGQAATAIKTGVQTIFSGLTNIQRAVTGGASSFRELRAFATLKKKILQPLQAFGKAFTGVAQNVDKLGTAAKAFAKVGGTLGKIFSAFKVIGRFIAFPLTVIMGIVDGFKGLMSGMERQEGTFNKVIGGAIGAISGVIKGLLMVPLDLLKDGISWIAGKLGFENFSAMLDNFSFAETFTSFTNRLTDGIIYTFTSLFDSVMKPFEDGVDFGSILEFVVTLPHKLLFGFLDLIKGGVGALLGAFGATDMEASLGEFSFLDSFDKLIEFVKGLPSMLADAVLSFFDPSTLSEAVTVAGDFASMAMEKLKSAVRALLPDPDSILANVIPNAVYDWVGEAPPPAPEETPPAVMAEETPELATQTPAEPPARTEVSVVETTGTDDDGFQFVERKRVEKPIAGTQDVYGDEFTDQFGRTRRQTVFEADPEIAAKLQKDNDEFFAEMDRLDAARRNTGQELDTMSRENAQQGGGNTVTIAAPSQSNVTNNNSNTSAVIDQNLPTVDHNDRLTWQGGVGLV